MKSRFPFFILLVLITLLSQKEALAVKAYPSAVKHKQPDGSVVHIIMKGDEKIRWAETTDGYSLIRNKNGGWEYGVSNKNGDMVCSGMLAKEISNRTIKDISLLQRTKKRLSFSKSQVNILKQVRRIKEKQKVSAFPVTGTINLLMILVEFQDVEFTKTKTEFENLMNQVNYNTTGSFKDFYLENSYGNLTINTIVAGVYKAANDMAYYGTNSPSDDFRVGELITEAVTFADTDVDFSIFDNDQDGTVDGIYVIYAGYGEEAGGGSNPDAIWAHASSIDELTFDGTVVGKYACSCELRGNEGTDITAIGVICHEFGHSLGAPDYYDTNYDTDGQYPGTDQWDVMAGGSWNNDGNTPAQHNPYTKSKIFNWATATVINNAQTVTLRDIVTYPDIVQINTTTPNEYFLCENKQWTGFNYWVPGHGMIIYHVDGDYVTSHDPNNDFNAGAHQGMYVVSSSATTDNGVMENGDINTEDCPWPGTGAKTTFDDATTPSSKSWAGEKTEKPFTNIAENSGTITFDITFESLSNFVATPFSNSQIDLSWNNNSNNDAVMITVNSTSTFGTPVDATTYSVGNSIDGGGTVIFNGSGASFNHTLLTPNTVYYYKAWSILSGNIYSAGVANNAATLCGSSLLPFTETFDGTTIPECWSQVDHQGNGQIWEFGTTSSFGSQAPNLANGNYAYLNSDNYGNGNTQNADLITPVIDMRDFSAVNIQFNHFHQFWDATNASATFSYSIDNGATWNIIQQWTESTTNPVSFNQNITEIAGQQEVKLKWNYSATYGGGWAIDDISITGLTPLTWTGTVDNNWNDARNWNGGNIPTSASDVIIPSSGPNFFPIIFPMINADCNNLTVNNPGSLTIASAPIGSGSLIVHGVALGFVSTQSYLTANQWHIVSPCVNGSSISSFISNNAENDIVSKEVSGETVYGIMDYNENSDEWNSYFNASNSNNFSSGIGYCFRRSSDGTINFYGDLNTGTKNINLTRTGSGWNCVGNPYTSAIGLNSSAETFENFITLNSGNLDGSYACVYVWNDASKTYDIIRNIDAATYFQAGQGFFVKAKDASSSLQFTKDMQLHQPSAALKSATKTWPEIKLTATDGIKNASAVVSFNSQMTNGLDPMYDAGLLRGSSGLNIYSRLVDDNGVDFAVQCLPEKYDSLVIPIGVDYATEGNLVFNAEVTDIPDGCKVILEDKLTGDSTLVSNGDSYSVAIDTSTIGIGRFYLHLLTPKIIEEPTVSNSTNRFKLKAFQADNQILIIGNVGYSAGAYLVDINGRKLGKFKLNEGTRNSISTKGLIRGMYLLTVTDAGKKFTTKIAVK